MGKTGEFVRTMVRLSLVHRLVAMAIPHMIKEEEEKRGREAAKELAEKLAQVMFRIQDMVNRAVHEYEDYVNTLLMRFKDYVDAKMSSVVSLMSGSTPFLEALYNDFVSLYKWYRRDINVRFVFGVGMHAVTMFREVGPIQVVIAFPALLSDVEAYMSSSRDVVGEREVFESGYAYIVANQVALGGQFTFSCQCEIPGTACRDEFARRVRNLALFSTALSAFNGVLAKEVLPIAVNVAKALLDGANPLTVLDRFDDGFRSAVRTAIRYATVEAGAISNEDLATAVLMSAPRLVPPAVVYEELCVLLGARCVGRDMYDVLDDQTISFGSLMSALIHEFGHIIMNDNMNTVEVIGEAVAKKVDMEDEYTRRFIERLFGKPNSPRFIDYVLNIFEDVFINEELDLGDLTYFLGYDGNMIEQGSAQIFMRYVSVPLQPLYVYDTRLMPAILEYLYTFDKDSVEKAIEDYESYYKWLKGLKDALPRLVASYKSFYEQLPDITVRVAINGLLKGYRTPLNIGKDMMNYVSNSVYGEVVDGTHVLVSNVAITALAHHLAKRYGLPEPRVGNHWLALFLFEDRGGFVTRFRVKETGYMTNKYIVTCRVNNEQTVVECCMGYRKHSLVAETAMGGEIGMARSMLEPDKLAARDLINGNVVVCELSGTKKKISSLHPLCQCCLKGGHGGPCATKRDVYENVQVWSGEEEKGEEEEKEKEEEEEKPEAELPPITVRVK